MKKYENFISDFFKTIVYKDFDYVLINIGYIVQIIKIDLKRYPVGSIKLYKCIDSDNDDYVISEKDIIRKATKKEIENYELKKQATTYNL